VKGCGLPWLSRSCPDGIAHWRVGVLRVGRGSRSRSSYRRIPMAMSDPREERRLERGPCQPAASLSCCTRVLWVGGDVAAG
jgi:hypothetical protein